MTLTITPQGIMYTLLVILFSIITFYLVKTLINLNKLLDNINLIIASNKKNIDESLSNVNMITNSAKNKMEFIDKFIKPEEAATTSEGYDIVSIIASIIELVNEIKSIWPKKKKPRR